MEVDDNHEEAELSSEDLALLVAPEGSVIPTGEEEAGDEGKEGRSGDGKRNANTADDDLIGLLAGEEGSDDDDDEDDDDEDGEGKAGTSVNIGQLVTQQARALLGKDIKLPKDINRDNLVERLVGLGRQTLHPEALRLQAAIDQGLKPQEFYQQYSEYDRLLAQDDRTLVKYAFEQKFGKNDNRPDGWDEEKIKAKLDRMDEDQIEETAFGIRENIRGAKAKRDQELESYAGGNKPDYSSPEFQERFNKRFDEGFDGGIGEERGLYGLKFTSDKVLNAAKSRLRDMLTPDPEKGIDEFTELMRDQDNLMRAALLFSLAETGALKLEVQKVDANTRKAVGKVLAKGGKKASTKAGGADDPSKDLDFKHFV